MPSVSAIIAAAGESNRLGGQTRKPFIKLAGKPIVLRSAERIARIQDIAELIVMFHPDDVQRAADLLPHFEKLRPTQIAAGGKTRQDTVRLALDLVGDNCDIVLIHDAARPLVKPEHIAETIRKACETGAAILASPVRYTVKRVEQGIIKATVPRHDLWAAQTPQVFLKTLLVEAYRQAEADGIRATDDAQLVEHLGHPVAVVEGSDDNVKITFPADLAIAETLLKRQLEKRE